MATARAIVLIMAKELHRIAQVRQMIAQQAARMIAEDGVSDFAYAKKKASRQLGVTDVDCLPSNAEIEEEVKLYHEIFNADEHPQALHELRKDALEVMKLLQKFNPYLTGTVLDGTAGKFAETHIHLYADSVKELEMFLLNQQIPYDVDEKTFRTSRDKRASEKKGGDTRKKVPLFILEGPNGLIKLSVFEMDDMRTPTRNVVNGDTASKVNIEQLKQLIAHAPTPSNKDLD